MASPSWYSVSDILEANNGKSLMVLGKCHLEVSNGKSLMLFGKCHPRGQQRFG
jgi:hypothetical protein